MFKHFTFSPHKNLTEKIMRNIVFVRHLSAVDISNCEFK